MDDLQVSFIELVALTRITPDSTVEKFGAIINSSFFDASNILATLKQKNLVDFVTAFPSQSTLKITDKGTAFLAEANAKAAEPLDALDNAILAQLSGGKRSLVELSGAVNVGQRDLALHIYKLSSQQDITYELVNAAVSLYLTEKGFVAAKGQQPTVPGAPQPAAANATMGSPPHTVQAPEAEKMDSQIKVLEAIAKKQRAGKRRMLMVLGIVLIVVVLIVVLDVMHIIMI